MPPFSDKTTVAVPADEPRAQRLAAVLDDFMRELETGGIPPDVEALIAAHPDLADELRSYADSLKLLHQMTAGLRPTQVTAPADAESSSGGMPTKRLGDYDIIREIGRGGMGIVYEARQLSLNRQVALKVLPFAAMLDDKQIARFRNEAQAAAQLHHPNIVPVYAVGQERGVHYFAMQLVPGQSLETALQELRGENPTTVDATKPSPTGRGEGEGASRLMAPPHPNPLPEGEGVASATLRLADTAHFGAFSTRASTRSRGYCHSVARLMIQAAEALQHAHEYGVVHRDVKPSNLLLDRAGKLWVTDFGLARIQSDSGVTITGDVVGTLRYMSPEQAAGATALVDVRADVYSLGATLYELLTLRPAHLGDNRQEVLRHIERTEPTPPRQLNPAVPVDLETITLRALAKTREERYATAQEFATDLKLFLEGKPTVAQRPTMLDRAAKWALRHRRAVSLVAAGSLLLAVVSVTAAVLIAQAKSRTDSALVEVEASAAKTQRLRVLAEKVVERLGGGWASELSGVPGIEPVRARLLTESLAYYRQLIDEASGDPRLQRELADALFKAAGITASLGDSREAIALCRQAIERYDALVSQTPTDAELSRKRAKCYGSLGLLLAESRDVEGALAAYEQAIKQQLAMADRKGSTDVMSELADTYGKLGLLLGELGRKEQARLALDAGISVIEKLIQGRSDDLTLRHDLALTYNSLSFVERDFDWSRAEACCRKAVALLERLATEPSASPEYRADLALCLNNLGAILGHRQQWNDAVDAYDRAIQYQEPLVRQSPAVVAYRRDLAVSWNNLGDARDAAGDLTGAIDAFDEAEKIIAVLVTDYPDEVRFRGLYGAVLNNRATRLEESGDVDAALAAYEAGVAQQRAAFERAPQIAAYRDALSKHYYNYARALRTAGRPGPSGEAALARRALWAGDGEHLVQVTLELAEAAAAARDATAGASEAEATELADRFEAETAATLRDALAVGGDLSPLRDEPVFSTLHDSSIWTTIKEFRGASSGNP
jgi:eukaryotic-like serine/threonine-protein kinase